VEQGHCLAAQDLLREQGHHAVSVNLLEDSAGVLLALCASSATLRHMEEAEVSATSFLASI
jgi:hypothetical protein